MDLDVGFRAGGPLVTEYSCKFHVEALADELRIAGDHVLGEGVLEATFGH